MVEYIEELDVEAQLYALGQRKPLGQVEVTPRKIGTFRPDLGWGSHPPTQPADPVVEPTV